MEGRRDCCIPEKEPKSPTSLGPCMGPQLMLFQLFPVASALPSHVLNYACP
jgi:hypothetical protein